ncbi:MAG: 3-deoxy-D-manno-octulosonic acid transferase [Nitrospirota bacterium]
MIFFLYGILLYVFALFYFPYMLISLMAKGKKRAGIGQRFGFFKTGFFNQKKRKRVWFHAVSVGETVAAAPLVIQLKEAHPDTEIYFSTVTETGNKIAHEKLGDKAKFFFFPFDFAVVVRRVIGHMSPDLFVVVETEIWPNLLKTLHDENIPSLIVNGRISPRSLKGYSRFRFFFRRVLPLVSRFLMQSEMDAERIIQLGAPPDRVSVAGNIKFDQAIVAGKPAVTRAALGIPEGAKVFIAGSTHQGEEDEALKAYKKLLMAFPDMVMVLAPRHPERFAAAEESVKRAGFACRRKSTLTPGPSSGSVLLLDTMGELAGTYAVGDINFVGGSWAEVGGHNILEPASFGKPVLFGPVMHNFRDISRILKDCGAGIEVRDGEELATEAAKLLCDPARYSALGKAALEAIEKNKGALAKDFKAVEEMLHNAPSVPLLS